MAGRRWKVLIAIAVIVGIALLGKGAKKLVQPTGDQFDPTAMSRTQTTKTDMPDGSPTFTPTKGTSSTGPTLPFQLVGMNHADPSRMFVKLTYDSSKPSIQGKVGMLAAQDAFNVGGYK
jgi:hypothetical protein